MFKLSDDTFQRAPWANLALLDSPLDKRERGKEKVSPIAHVTLI